MQCVRHWESGRERTRKAVKGSVTIKQNYEFRRLYAKGKSAVTPSMVMYCRKNGRDHNRLGVTVSTKLGGAVVRNRARRRLRELFRLSQGCMVQGYDVLLVARGRTARIPHRYLRRDYETALKKLGLVSEEGAEK